MATVKHDLKDVPVRVSTGLKEAYVQSLDGSIFRYVQSTNMPSKDIFHIGREMSIGEGFSIWAWNPGAYPVTLVVSTAE